MKRSLDFYLALGCGVDRAADSWVQLHLGHSRLVISPATGPITPTGASLTLDTDDGRAPIHLMAMGRVLTSVPDAADQLLTAVQVTDPDGHLLRIILGGHEPTPMTPETATA
ncbi:MAG: VOC family protein [Actinomycetota bacterium]|nr:VOC family protein [Actinomycetota bacterium]